MERVCSECGVSLGDSPRNDKKTCGPAHRKARSVRLAKQRKNRSAAATDARTHPEHIAPLSDQVTKDIAREVAREEMRPVIREAMTDDVLSAVGELVSLTPLMVAAIKADLTSRDEGIRQRAYTLLARYTLGNPSVAPASVEQAPSPMQVVFNLPRPGDDVTVDATAEEVDAAVQPRACIECGNMQAANAFVSGSDRCLLCHAALRKKVEERFPS